jgi:trigger factor
VNITRENISDLHLKLKVNVSTQDYLPTVEKGIKEAGKKMQMPGFRAGKVPASFAKKMYGNTVLAEELDKILNNSVNTYIKENELAIFGQPLPIETGLNKLDINEMIDYNFEFELGLVPPFEPVNIEGRTFNAQTTEVTEEMLNEEVEKVSFRFGTESDIDSIEDDMSIIVAQFDELENGNIKEGGISSGTSFGLKVVKDETTKSKIKELKKEDTLDLNINTTFGNDHNLIVHTLLNIDHAKADAMNPEFRLTIKGLKRIEKAELNKEVFDKAYGEGKINSVDELKEKIKTQLEKEFERVSNVRVENDIHKVLLEETQLSFPEAFLKKWILANNKENKEVNDIPESEFKMILDRLKWDLIVDKLTKKYNIEIKIEDIRLAIRKEIEEKYFGGVADESMDALINSLIDSMLKEEKNIRRYTESALFDKVFAELRNHISLNTVSTNYHDFVHQH